MKCIDVADTTDIPLDICLKYCKNGEGCTQNLECVAYEKWRKVNPELLNDSLKSNKTKAQKSTETEEQD